MDAEVVVVGGGIGGLTTAALLAHRGVDVCLLERESVVGGCVASFEKFDYTFEPTYGLYTGWNPGEIFDRIFSELQMDPPEVHRHEPAYTVLLPDGVTVPLTSDRENFDDNLRVAFAECAEPAVRFYQELESAKSTSPKRKTIAELLGETSWRFRRFLEVQLSAFAQTTSAEIACSQAAPILTAGLGGMFGIKGGAASLANKLAESIKKSGGKVRLNSPVLRLSYDSAGVATGVDLLTGETVNASKAIISNLTLWDTYGKLVGLNRTPSDLRRQLSSLKSWGVYSVYLGVDEEAMSSLPADHLLALTEWDPEESIEPHAQQLFIAAAPSWDARAPEGKRAMTVHVPTDVDEWFTFHTDEAEHEAQDQKTLERVWNQLHSIAPALISKAEVIETATPRTYYEQTRRKLGMVGGLPLTEFTLAPTQPNATPVSNLFIVSDTTTPGGLMGLAVSAASLADSLSR